MFIKIASRHSWQKYLFLLGVTALYVGIIAWLDFLQGPPVWDEKTFWRTSLTFSDTLFPSIDDLSNYRELSTPLPFIIYGALEYLFDQGMWVGRLLNLILSLVMVFMVGWPGQDRRTRSLLCLVGLLVCPYFLWLSGRLYTDLIACFWVLIGVASYVKNRHLISGIAFVLAIASRQYMVAFPAAIATYELIAIADSFWRAHPADHRRWLIPVLAALTLFGWFYLFKGLAPAKGLVGRSTPEVQRTLWALKPGGAINFLASVGAYIVIPEFILFFSPAKLKSWWPQRQKATAIALGLLVFVVVFPPLSFATGPINKVSELMPHSVLNVAMYYGLSLLTCLRFSQPGLLPLMVLFNALIMMKAHPWDRYVLPLVIVFWYLKSIGIMGQPLKLALPILNWRRMPE